MTIELVHRLSPEEEELARLEAELADRELDLARVE